MRYRDSLQVKVFRETASLGVKVKGSDSHLNGVRACLENRGGSPATIGCVKKETTKSDADAFDSTTSRMREEALRLGARRRIR